MESPCECGIEPPGSISHGVSELVMFCQSLGFTIKEKSVSIILYIPGYYNFNVLGDMSSLHNLINCMEIWDTKDTVPFMSNIMQLFCFIVD